MSWRRHGRGGEGGRVAREKVEQLWRAVVQVGSKRCSGRCGGYSATKTVGRASTGEVGRDQRGRKREMGDSRNIDSQRCVRDVCE